MFAGMAFCVNEKWCWPHSHRSQALNGCVAEVNRYIHDNSRPCKLGIESIELEKWLNLVSKCQVWRFGGVGLFFPEEGLHVDRTPSGTKYWSMECQSRSKLRICGLSTVAGKMGMDQDDQPIPKWPVATTKPLGVCPVGTPWCPNVDPYLPCRIQLGLSQIGVRYNYHQLPGKGRKWC